VSALPPDLQSAFVESRGEPIPFGDEEVVQAHRWRLDGPAVVEIRFADGTIFEGQSVRLSVKKPGRIYLSDGSFVSKVAIHDQARLPRFVRHRIEPNGSDLLIYNSYTIHRAGRPFEESWTGNAGMIVTPLSENVHRCECSDNVGAFDRSNLVFDVTVLSGDAPWLPEEIYA
jgi:hypothetical protein